MAATTAVHVKVCQSRLANAATMVKQTAPSRTSARTATKAGHLLASPDFYASLSKGRFNKVVAQKVGRRLLGWLDRAAHSRTCWLTRTLRGGATRRRGSHY